MNDDEDRRWTLEGLIDLLAVCTFIFAAWYFTGHLLFAYLLGRLP
ncbi:MAG: hypothetical protein H6Q73_884 [Firmicutes bacterium]|nr:hypothetical protein [Bacillota bacterium]